ncbi:MAG: aspartate--tRNA ligase [Endomicrobiales bacterium]|nr:aspartate--tRNA ligase [Endomicrobiales bacterium]
MQRTHYCGALRASDTGKKAVLCGWVHSRRDHGGVIFIDLRDREGLAQIVFQPEKKEMFSAAEKLRSEFVLKVSGSVRRRPAGTENPNMPTGEVEVVADELVIINPAPGLPFEISDFIDTSEEMRLKYRFLDLRRPKIQKNFVFRHRVLQAVRNYLCKEGFLEIETPFLTKSTPEGARDFLVPSRLSNGNFYALPQSPQLFKQILMVSGFDRYFQVVKCFRDEDLRADRQPEFTQVDLEMSFVDENDVIGVIEGALSAVFKEALGAGVKTPFRRMPYDEAMLKYGSDKPDTRFGMEITDFSQELKSCGFKVFKDAVDKGGVVRGLCVPKGAAFSRSEIDGLTKFVGDYGAKGLAWMKMTDAGPESNIVKFFSKGELETIGRKTGARSGDLLVFLADDVSVVAQGLCALRLKLGRELKLIDEKRFDFVWVVDFPLLEWDREEKRWNAMHHPFTSPKEEDLPLLDSGLKEDCARMRARAYDIVLNGVELGGGSVRIHGRDVQKKMFGLLNVKEEEAKEKFGFLLDALSYGAPPHAGIALGFDRLCAILLGEESIREVIAFPKTQKAACLMSGAPGRVGEKQIKELGIKLNLPKPQ